MARVPLFASQTPAVQRFRVGHIEVTAISDGYFDIPFEQFPQASLDEIHDLQRSDHLPVGPTIREGMTCFVVNTGKELVLIDAGARDHMVPTAGQFLHNLNASGYKPEQFDQVILTHMHPDHIGGIADASGKAVFANATLHKNELDHKFWLDPSIRARAPAAAAMLWDVASESVKPYVDRLSLFNFNADFGDGLSVIDMAGHTPGHSGIRISAGNDQLFILGDIAHSVSLQFAYPDWGISFDVDKEAAVATRVRRLNEAAADGILVAGSHFPFPCLGYVERNTDSFRFLPVRWNYELE